jgi:hypothetical protein
MLKKTFAAVAMAILLGLINVQAQQGNAEQSAKQTEYEKFLTRTGAVIVTKAYPIGKLAGGGGPDTTVNVAWVLGETDKVYAARIGWRVVDFEQLKEMQDGLDKIIQAINSSFVKLDAASMSYVSPAGLSVSYYTYNDPVGKPKRNLYVAIGSYVSQGQTIETVVELKNLIAQAREKLISLGAK